MKQLFDIMKILRLLPLDIVIEFIVPFVAFLFFLAVIIVLENKNKQDRFYFVCSQAMPGIDEKQTVKSIVNC